MPERGPSAPLGHPRRMLFIAVVVGPFFFVPTLSRWMVPRMARAMVERLAPMTAHLASEPLSRGGENMGPVQATSCDVETAEPLTVDSSSRAGESTPTPRRHKRKVLYFGRDLVARAIPVASRPTGSVVTATQEQPAGIIIRRPGILAATLHAGDVLIEAEGVPLVSFETLVTIVGHAYDVRARTISGKLWRRGEVFGVVVEPPW